MENLTCMTEVLTILRVSVGEISLGMNKLKMKIFKTFPLLVTPGKVFLV